MPDRPAITWGQLKDWAAASEVPDDATVIEQQYQRPISEITLFNGDLIFRLAQAAELMTWGKLKASAELSHVADDARLSQERGTDYFRIVDLGSWEEDPGEHYLILQTRWG